MPNPSQDSIRAYGRAWRDAAPDLRRWVEGYRRDVVDYEQAVLLAKALAVLADDLRESLPDWGDPTAREMRVMASVTNVRKVLSLAGVIPTDTLMRQVRTGWERDAAYTATLVSDVGFQAERDVAQQAITGDVWFWKSRLDTRVCLVCIMLHGSVHPSFEPMTKAHPNCRCVPVGNPLTPGKEWLLARSPSTFRAMLGPGRVRLVEEGHDLDLLVDLSRRRVRPLREFGRRLRAYGTAKKAPRRKRR